MRPIRAMPCPCLYVPCRAHAYTYHAVPMSIRAMPCPCLYVPCRAHAYTCRAMPCPCLYVIRLQLLLQRVGLHSFIHSFHCASCCSCSLLFSLLFIHAIALLAALHTRTVSRARRSTPQSHRRVWILFDP